MLRDLLIKYKELSDRNGDTSEIEKQIGDFLEIPNMIVVHTIFEVCKQKWDIKTLEYILSLAKLNYFLDRNYSTIKPYADKYLMLFDSLDDFELEGLQELLVCERKILVLLSVDGCEATNQMFKDFLEHRDYLKLQGDLVEYKNRVYYGEYYED